MGWWPTSPDYADFPRPAKVTGNFIHVKRGHMSKKGNPKNPQKVGDPGPNKPRTMYSRLVANARAMGWVNGQRIRRGVPR